MILSIQDILMLSLQFLYAFGGLILMGSLIFNIMKNQARVNEKQLRFEEDFDVTLSSQLAEQRPRSTLNVGQPGVNGNRVRRRDFRKTNSKEPGTSPGSKTTGDDINRKARPLPVHDRVAGLVKASPYKVAAGMAARGFTAKDIWHRVALPRCEIDLITSIHDRHAKGRWEAHQSMLDSIDSGT